MGEIPKRPRRSAIDYAHVNSQLETGLTIRGAWKLYANTAANPYAYNTFNHLVRRWRGNEADSAVEIPDTFAASEEFWSERLSPTSKLLAVEGNAPSLTVKHGNLRLWDRVTGANTFTPAGSKPQAIVFMGWGGTISIEAMRWCAHYEVAVFVIDWHHDLLSFIHPGPAQEAAMIRAQLAADPLTVAKALVVKKFEHMRAARGLTIEEAAKFIADVRRVDTIADIMRVEGRAGGPYWDRYQCELRPRGRSSAPYEPFTSRRGASPNSGPRNATHPVNALLNLAYEIASGRLGVLLAAAGFATAIGFLHVDKKSRHSLVWDVIEILRPIIDKRVFTWIAENRFSKSDFIQLKDPNTKAGIIRIAPSLRRVFASETALPQSDLIEAVEFMRGLILRS